MKDIPVNIFDEEMQDLRNSSLIQDNHIATNNYEQEQENFLSQELQSIENKIITNSRNLQEISTNIRAAISDLKSKYENEQEILDDRISRFFKNLEEVAKFCNLAAPQSYFQGALNILFNNVDYNIDIKNLLQSKILPSILMKYSDEFAVKLKSIAETLSKAYLFPKFFPELYKKITLLEESIKNLETEDDEEYITPQENAADIEKLESLTKTKDAWIFLIAEFINSNSNIIVKISGKLLSSKDFKNNILSVVTRSENMSKKQQRDIFDYLIAELNNYNLKPIYKDYTKELKTNRQKLLYTIMKDEQILKYICNVCVSISKKITGEITKGNSFFSNYAIKPTIDSITENEGFFEILEDDELVKTIANIIYKIIPTFPVDVYYAFLKNCTSEDLSLVNQIIENGLTTETVSGILESMTLDNRCFRKALLTEDYNQKVINMVSEKISSSLNEHSQTLFGGKDNIYCLVRYSLENLVAPLKSETSSQGNKGVLINANNVVSTNLEEIILFLVGINNDTYNFCKSIVVLHEKVPSIRNHREFSTALAKAVASYINYESAHTLEEWELAEYRSHNLFNIINPVFIHTLAKVNEENYKNITLDILREHFEPLHDEEYSSILDENNIETKITNLLIHNEDLISEIRKSGYKETPYILNFINSYQTDQFLKEDRVLDESADVLKELQRLALHPLKFDDKLSSTLLGLVENLTSQSHTNLTKIKALESSLELLNTNKLLLAEVSGITHHESTENTLNTKIANIITYYTFPREQLHVNTNQNEAERSFFSETNQGLIAARAQSTALSLKLVANDFFAHDSCAGITNIFTNLQTSKQDIETLQIISALCLVVRQLSSLRSDKNADVVPFINSISDTIQQVLRTNSPFNETQIINYIAPILPILLNRVLTQNKPIEEEKMVVINDKYTAILNILEFLIPITEDLRDNTNNIRDSFTNITQEKLEELEIFSSETLPKNILDKLIRNFAEINSQNREILASLITKTLTTNSDKTLTIDEDKIVKKIFTPEIATSLIHTKYSWLKNFVSCADILDFYLENKFPVSETNFKIISNKLSNDVLKLKLKSITPALVITILSMLLLYFCTHFSINSIILLSFGFGLASLPLFLFQAPMYRNFKEKNFKTLTNISSSLILIAIVSSLIASVCNIFSYNAVPYIITTCLAISFFIINNSQQKSMLKIKEFDNQTVPSKTLLGSDDSSELSSSYTTNEKRTENNLKSEDAIMPTEILIKKI